MKELILFLISLIAFVICLWGIRKMLSYEKPKSVANILIRQPENFFIIVTYLISRDKNNFRTFSDQVVDELRKPGLYDHFIGILNVLSQMSDVGVVNQEMLHKLFETLAVTTKEPHLLIKDAKESKEIEPRFIAACIEYLAFVYCEPKNKNLSDKASKVVDLFNEIQSKRKTFFNDFISKLNVILGDRLDNNAVLDSWFCLFQFVERFVNNGKLVLNKGNEGGGGINGSQQPHFLLKYFQVKWKLVPAEEAAAKLLKTDNVSLPDEPLRTKEEGAVACQPPVAPTDAGDCMDSKALSHDDCSEMAQSKVVKDKDIKQDKELIVMNKHRVFVEEAFAHTIPDLCAYYRSVGKQIIFDCRKVDCAGQFLDVWALQQSSKEHGQPLRILISARFVIAVLFDTTDNNETNSPKSNFA